VTVVIPFLHGSSKVRQIVRRGLPRRGVRVATCRSTARLEAYLGRELIDAVVVDVRASWAAPALDLIPRYPRIPFFALSRFRPDDGILLTACRRRGVRDVFVEGVDGQAAGELIASRTASNVRKEALGGAPAMLRLTESIQLRAWEEVLKRAGTPTTTSEIARAVKRTREHLSREFGAGGAPNLKRVIDLARAAGAADLLGNPGSPVATVAAILGYASPGHLAECGRRVAGATPVELGRMGPRGVLDRFRRGRMRSRV
jgi:transcriptional regulator GlxA family with amidase domain